MPKVKAPKCCGKRMEITRDAIGHLYQCSVCGHYSRPIDCRPEGKIDTDYLDDEQKISLRRMGLNAHEQKT